MTPPTSTPADDQVFMVVATIRADTDFAELAARRADEEQQLERLRAEGRIGAHHVAVARRTAFLEVVAADEEQVGQTLASLPFAKFFDVDIYATGPPEA